MSDTHIQYYSYGNTQGDGFGTMCLSNKKEWVRHLNRYQESDGEEHRYTVEEWDKLDSVDWRDILIAEVIQDDTEDFVLREFVVNWIDGNNKNSVRITHNNQLVWENNPGNSLSVPKWISRLKNLLRET